MAGKKIRENPQMLYASPPIKLQQFYHAYNKRYEGQFAHYIDLG